VKALGSVLLGAVCIALLLAPSAQAHKLTANKAEAFLNPIAASMAPQLAPKIAAKLPGATISKTEAKCTRALSGEKHVVACSLNFLVAGASTGETGCFVLASVKFLNRKSRKLKYSLDDSGLLTCLFQVPL
jgi:hypothetical protein